MRDRIFAAIARRFPTERIGESRFLAGIWRTLFYLLKPARPFIMQLPYYRLWVHPKKGTLTRVVLRRGYWEPVQTAFFRQHLKPGDFVIDAGANFGHYALVAADAVGETGLIIAFEPYPPCHALLSENVALLPGRNVIAEQAGFAATSGEMELIADDANPGGHSFNPAPIWKQGQKVKVPVFALDDYLAQKGITRKLDVLKCDTQGYEWQVLQGARKTILRDKPTVFCEVSPGPLAKIGDSYQDLIGFFEDAGYSTLFTDRETGAIRPVPLTELKALLANPAFEFEDVIFLPPETDLEARLDRVPDEAGEIGVVEAVDLLDAGR